MCKPPIIATNAIVTIKQNIMAHGYTIVRHKSLTNTA